MKSGSQNIIFPLHIQELFFCALHIFSTLYYIFEEVKWEMSVIRKQKNLLKIQLNRQIIEKRLNTWSIKRITVVAILKRDCIKNYNCFNMSWQVKHYNIAQVQTSHYSRVDGLRDWDCFHLLRRNILII